MAGPLALNLDSIFKFELDGAPAQIALANEATTAKLTQACREFVHRIDVYNQVVRRSLVDTTKKLINMVLDDAFGPGGKQLTPFFSLILFTIEF